MGFGSYSCSAYATRATCSSYDTKTVGEIFTNTKTVSEMDPKGVLVRESRDSQEHPNTVPIIIALDVTGSMGSIPQMFVRNGMSNIMKNLKVEHPSLLFMAIGDHECDRAPLQVGQFEASDELLEKWLTSVFMESGGGGNDGESYLLAWYFASRHTSIDIAEKRGGKGYLFTIGDEPTLKNLSKTAIMRIMGSSQASDMTATELLDEAKKKYNVYHLHIMQGSNGKKESVMGGWKQLLGDKLIIVQHTDKIPEIIADIVNENKLVVETTTKTNSDDSTYDSVPGLVINDML